MGAGRPERSAIGTEQEQGIRSRLPALVKQQQTEQMSAAALRPGRPSGRAAAVGSEQRLSTRRCGRVVALNEGAEAPWMYRCPYVGELLGSKRRSKPSKMSDRSASLRRLFTTASGRESFPRSAGSPGSAQTRTTLGLIQSCSPGPPARHQPQPSSRRRDRQQDPQRPVPLWPRW